MNNRMQKLFFSIVAVFVFIACNQKGQGTNTGATEDVLTGELQVLVDETVLPIMKEQVDVFQSSYSNAAIQLVPKPEIKAINALLADSAGVIILTRKLNDTEAAYFKSRDIIAREYQIASDAVVLINNKSDQDTIMKLSDVKSLLIGAEKGKKKVVFDNANSSTLRFLKEYLAIDSVDVSAISALGNNEEVITYVASNPGTIGIVGFNWMLYLKEKNADLFNNIRTLSIQNAKGDQSDGLFYKPSQESMSLGLYPFTRPIYVLNYQPNMGLGLGFSAFLTGDRGQRIVLRSGLLPATMPGREIIIRGENSLN